MLTADLHLHSTFSIDGCNTLQEMTDAAWRAGLRTICFTEHVDHHPRDSGYGFYDYDAYRDAVMRVKEANESRIEVLWGIEFSEPHLYSAELEREQQRGYDFIIGSQHFLGNWFFGEREMLEQWTRDEVFSRYYEELLKMAVHGGFDVMGHIGFPCRYIGDHPMPDDVAHALTTQMVKSGILPEINTSGFRKGYPRTLPDEPYLRVWRELSCGRVTVGSDAHRVGEPGSGLEKAEEAVDKLGLETVVFRNRKADPA